MLLIVPDELNQPKETRHEGLYPKEVVIPEK